VTFPVGRFGRILYGQPVKSFINVFFTLVGNVLAGACILDIMRPIAGAVPFPDWQDTPAQPIFLGCRRFFRGIQAI